MEESLGRGDRSSSKKMVRGKGADYHLEKVLKDVDGCIQSSIE